MRNLNRNGGTRTRTSSVSGELNKRGNTGSRRDNNAIEEDSGERRAGKIKGI